MQCTSLSSRRVDLSKSLNEILVKMLSLGGVATAKVYEKGKNRILSQVHPYFKIYIHDHLIFLFCFSFFFDLKIKYAVTHIEFFL